MISNLQHSQRAWSVHKVRRLDEEQIRICGKTEGDLETSGKRVGKRFSILDLSTNHSRESTRLIFKPVPFLARGSIWSIGRKTCNQATIFVNGNFVGRYYFPSFRNLFSNPGKMQINYFVRLIVDSGVFSRRFQERKLYLWTYAHT